MPETLPGQSRAFSRVGWALVLFLIAMQGSSVVIAVSVQLLAPQWVNSEAFFWCVSVLPTYAFAVPIFWLMTRSLPDSPPEAVHWPGFFQTACLFLTTLGMAFAGSLGANLLNYLLGLLIGRPIKNPTPDFSQYSIIMVFFVLCVLAPVFEELVFRGIFYRKLRQYGDGLCFVASAVLFAFLHGNTFQTVGVLLGAFVLSYTRLKTGNVLYCIAIHMTWNAIATLSIYAQNNLYFATLLGLGVIATIFVSLVLVVFIF